MRKIILLFMCAICTTVFGQDMVRELYPGTTVSPAHHMTFLGISMGKSPSAFGTSLKQKGFRYTKDPYSDDYFFKGNALGLKEVFMQIISDDTKKTNRLYITKKVYNKSAVETCIKALKSFVNVNYKNKSYTERKVYGNDGYKKKNCLWDVFSLNNKYHLGNIDVQISYYSKEYIFIILVEDVPNNDINYVQQRYDMSKYINPAYSKAYLDVYPNYSNLTLYSSDGTYTVYNITSPDDFIKFVDSNNYNDIEKQYIFNEYAKEVKSKNIPKTSSFYNIETIYKLRLDYDRAKESYLASHPKNNNGIANFIFDSIVGQDLVNLYKQTGQYDYFINCLKQGSRNRSQGGSSTNWDNLNDAQKAAIHEHDNAR